MANMEVWQIAVLVSGLTALIAVHLGYPLFLMVGGGMYGVREVRRRRARRNTGGEIPQEMRGVRSAVTGGRRQAHA